MKSQAVMERGSTVRSTSHGRLTAPGAPLPESAVKAAERVTSSPGRRNSTFDSSL